MDDRNDDLDIIMNRRKDKDDDDDDDDDNDDDDNDDDDFNPDCQLQAKRVSRCIYISAATESLLNLALSFFKVFKEQ